MTHTPKDAPKNRPPIRYGVGDTVVITEGTLEKMRLLNRNRTSSNWIADSFLKKMEALVGVQGRVGIIFPPTYRMVVAFNGELFNMRDDFVEPVAH